MPAQCWTSLHCTYIKGLCLCIGIISFPAGWDNEEVNIWNKLGFCSCCHCIFWLHNFGLPGLYIGHQEVEIPGRACLYEPQLHVSGRDQPWLYGWHHVHGRVKEVRWTPACHADATWTSGWQVRDNGLESSDIFLPISDILSILNQPIWAASHHSGQDLRCNTTFSSEEDGRSCRVCYHEECTQLS